MLGKSEMMISHRDLFAPIDLKLRIFRRLTAPPTLQSAGRRPGDGDWRGQPLAEDDALSRDAALEVGSARAGRSCRARAADVREPRRRGRCSGSALERPRAAVPGARALATSRSSCAARSSEALRERRRVALGEVSGSRPRDGRRAACST